MIEAHVGRLLAATLHEAIADELPDRLESYEEWLRPNGLRDGTIGLAPLTAVLGFLRLEMTAYPAINERAGRLAAQWTIASMSPGRRRVIGLLPRRTRLRASLRVASRIAQDVCSTTRTTVRAGRDDVQLNVRDSVFCHVRERPEHPLCGFYAAMAAETLTRFGLAADGHVESCRAMTGESCVMHITLTPSDRHA